MHVMSGPMPAFDCRTCCPASGKSPSIPAYPSTASDGFAPVYMTWTPQTWKLPAPYLLWDSHAADSLPADTLLTSSVSMMRRDGETELVSDALEQQPAQVKLLYAGSAAGIIILGASAVCWLTGNDLLGGASLSPHSLKAAEVHALPVTRRLAHHDPIHIPRLWSTSLAHASGV